MKIPGLTNCYKVGTDYLSQSDAEKSCQMFHSYSHLVVIDNAVEQNAISTWWPTQLDGMPYSFTFVFVR